MASRPAVAGTAALRALPVTDRRLRLGRALYIENETALGAKIGRLRGAPCNAIDSLAASLAADR
jgi:hypothetical protein